MKTVGTSVHHAGAAALLTRARLESAVADTPMSAPADDGTSDSYETAEARGDKPSNTDLDAASTNEANPFDGLERSDADDVRLSGHLVGIDVALDATHAQLARLNAALLAMARAGKEVPSHLIEAFMLLAHDAQATEQPLSPAHQERLSAYAAKLTTNEATDTDHRQFWGLAQVAEEDVMAYVQRVLRESYLIGNGLLYDMAMQLKKTNDLRKKVRDELAMARTTQASWAGQAKGDATWTSKTPYYAMTVNEDAGTLDPDLMNEDELQQHDAEVAAAPPSGTPAPNLAGFFKPGTGLSDQQTYDLKTIATSDKGLIKDNLDTITAMLPAMTLADFKQYVEPYLKTLSRGNTAEAAIFELFDTMTPAEVLQAVSDGFTAAYFDFGNDDARHFRQLTVDKLLSSFGSAITPADVSANDPRLAALEKSGFSPEALENQLQPDQALALLDRFVNQPTATTAASADSAKVGDQRMIDTTAGIDAYIQGLEDKLNSMGDDAQLMQVDMQEALQKNQQAIQTMSNLLKVVHDTAMAAIRNANS